MENMQLKHIVEAALLAAGRPMSLDELRGLFGSGDDAPPRQEVRAAVMELQADYAGRGIAVKEVASGFRVQVEPSMVQWLAKLWEERPPRYSRALMETLAIVAYRQPVTRGDVEEIRGVAVTTNIMRTLLERGWVRVVGYRDVPGKPAMYGTTREFLDYFGLKTLDELPSLAELQDMETLKIQLDLPDDVQLPDELTGDDGVVTRLDDARPAHDAKAAAAADDTAGQPGEAEAEAAAVLAADDEALAAAPNVIPLKSR